VDDTLARFAARKILRDNGGDIEVLAGGHDVLRFYANSVAHHFKGRLTIEMPAELVTSSPQD
jgi:glycerol-3-phosphate O-acyltransferase